MFADDGSGAVDVVERSEAIDVDAVLDRHLGPVLAEVLEDAAKRGIRSAPGEVKAGFDWTLADQLAHEWAQTASAQLVTGVSRRVRLAIRDVVALGVRENHSISEIAKNLRATIGLNTREARAVARMRRALIADGMEPNAAERRVAKRADVLIRKRARVIAQTEVKAAVEQGKLHEWRIMVAEGDLPSVARRKWIAGDACPLCRELARMAAVPLGEPFRSSGGDFMSPPAHPNCRCSCRIILSARRRTKDRDDDDVRPAILPLFRAAKIRPAHWGVVRGLA